MTRIRLISLGFVLLVACGELSRTPGVADGGAYPARSRCETCAAGATACTSGECMLTCEFDQPIKCVSGSRCLGGSCWPDAVPTCDDLPCNDDQFCHSAYCLTTTTHACSPTDDRECFSSEQCVPERGACVRLPPCNLDGTCHRGAQGAVCNRSSVTLSRPWTKYDADLCLLGRCTTNDHCPAPLTCQEIGAEVEGFGVCR